MSNKTNIKSSFNVDDEIVGDILSIERAILELKIKGLLTDDDIKFLEDFSYGLSHRKIGRILNKSNHTISKRFRNLCSRIAYYLGGYFTNDGYANYIKYKYNLSESQMEAIRKVLEKDNNKENVKTSHEYKEKSVI